MIGYDEALARLLALAEPLPAETVPLLAAAGRALAAPLTALRTQPPFPASAMDGYAVRAADLPGPWRVTGAVAAAGSAPGLEIGPGEAARIFTGAPVPEGANTVLIQENAARDGTALRLTGEPPLPGKFIRPAGLDFHQGEAVLPAGEPLTPAMLGLAASAGHAALGVARRPVVALLATGDELVEPGAALDPGQIVECIRPGLNALLAPIADVRDLGIARDDLGALTLALARADGADVLVTIGGASVGDRDLIRPALTAAGAETDFWRVAIRPGKPMLAGRLGGTVVLGLPGNPASAFVTAHLFLLPLLRRLAGWARSEPRLMPARLTSALPANDARRDHLRGKGGWDGPTRTATPAPRQDSSLQSVLAGAELLIVREPNAPAAAEGDCVEVLDLADWRT